MSATDDRPIDAEATAFIRSTMPLCAELGMSALEMDAARVVLRLEWTAERCTAGGVLHGGVLMALADTAGAVCAFLNLPDGAAATSTIESKTNFLGAVRDGMVVATSRPLHAGSSTVVVETEVHSGARLVAKTTQTQAVLRPK